jgi:DNA-binding MarR family transcriptional regulator/GNAT superfamily N-acetyltransferase
MLHEQRIATVRQFNRFYTQRIGVLGSGLLGTEYSLTEVRVLYELAQRTDALAVDLVRDLRLDAGYMSRILARFQKRGWLQRERSTDDTRRSFLKLTAKGRKAFAALDARARDEVGDMLEPLSAEQQARLQSHLEGVQAILGNDVVTRSEIIVRTHRPGDIGWIIRQHGMVYAYEYGWDVTFEALVAEICSKFIQNFDPTAERCWIAERSGVPIGCIMLVRHSRAVAKLRLLLVESSERGTGVGNKLVAECSEFARRCGYRTITLWTQSILTGARRLYESHGFKLVKSEPHASFGVKLVGETWELSLTESRS